MEVLIEATRSFEQDLDRLSDAQKTVVIQAVNDYASLFSTQAADVYHQLYCLPLASDLNGYESSLYVLAASQTLNVILAVDEDPIFGQVIITLFRAVNPGDLDRAYKGVAESLYQDLLHHHPETAEIS